MTETDRKVSRNFFKKDKDVYKLLMEIPAGKIATYGDIAKALGHPFAARAVGNILNKNPNPIVVPCHRIICSNGKMGGYAYGSVAKRRNKISKRDCKRFCYMQNSFKKGKMMRVNEFLIVL